MKTRSKVILLASALAFGVAEPASAIFVKPAVTYTAASAAATLPMEAVATSSTSTSLGTARAKHKKRGLLNRLAARITNATMKSKVVAAILCYFLGTLGVHRFYLGYTKIGLLQLLLGIAGFALLIAGLVSLSVGVYVLGYIVLLGLGIWVLIDFIRILTGSLEPMDGSYD